MSDFVRSTSSIRIERPVEVVRAQFRDIDHRIRNNVHPDIQYEWAPAEPGQRKVRTTFHILGVPQHDVSLLEDAPDGSFVMRCVEGKNAQLVLTHRFASLGPNGTGVEVTAEIPADRARGLLGSLVVAGLRQVIRKALAEDKRDLEGDQFVAGKAAGNLDRALALLRPAASGAASFVRPLSERPVAARRAVLDATCLIAVADGRFEPGELDALVRVADLIGAAGERTWIDARTRELGALAASPRVVEEAARVGRELVTHGVALEGITTAVVVALVSEGMSLGELELLRVLARVAGVAEGSLPAVIESAERALMSAG